MRLKITVFDIIPPGSHNPAGIPGLEIPQSRIPGLRKQVRDWNPYMQYCTPVIKVT